MSRPTFATAFLRWRACGWRRPRTRENRDGALRHLRLIRLILINEPHDIGHLQNRAQFPSSRRFWQARYSVSVNAVHHLVDYSDGAERSLACASRAPWSKNP